MTSLHNLDLVNFPDCPVKEMSIDIKSVQTAILFDFIQTKVYSEEWTTIDNAILKITNWNSLLIKKFIDDNWHSVDIEAPEYFKEVLNTEQQVDSLTLEGFSLQSGAWLRYEFIGENVELTLQPEISISIE